MEDDAASDKGQPAVQAALGGDIAALAATFDAPSTPPSASP